MTIPQPQPHGLKMNTIVYVFEQGEPNVGGAGSRRQVSGRVPRGRGAARRRHARSGHPAGRSHAARACARSPGPWALYETMPADTHELFAGSHGGRAAATAPRGERRGVPPPRPGGAQARGRRAFDPNIYMEDEAGHRVGPDERRHRPSGGSTIASCATTPICSQRPIASWSSCSPSGRRSTEDIKKLAAANETAKKLGAHAARPNRRA